MTQTTEMPCTGERYLDIVSIQSVKPASVCGMVKVNAII
jgi:hypothetical protein